MSHYASRPVGGVNTTEWTLYFEHNGTPVSPFHDIPLWVDKAKGIANMVVEIPRGTTAKLEINKALELNPIKQDIKEGKLREVTYRGGYPFNYGAFPQTWEDPSVVDEHTKTKGDNDPLDVCDISPNVSVTGVVKPVKILGVWAMIDAGETDWKILVIDAADPKADKIDTAEDAEREYPGAIATVFEFLENYKHPTVNKFEFGGKLLDKGKAFEVIHHTEEQWKHLIQWAPADAKAKKISVFNTQLANAGTVGLDDARKFAKY